MFSLKSLSILILGAIAVSTASAAPANDGAKLVRRDNDGYTSGDIRWSTFFGATTACGQNFAKGEADSQLYGGTSDQSDCGKKFNVVFDNGKSVDVTIVDVCSDCPFLLSKAAFEKSGLGVDAGIVSGKWKQA